jgi:hypothetical protein
MQTLRSRINRMNRKPEQWVVRVHPSEDGFLAFSGDGRTERLKWSKVKRVFTYKVDCFTYDMIWLTFEQSDRDEAIHIREEAEGFQDLMSAMGKAFPQIDPEWYFNVMQPPFAENLTVLFEREAEA